MKSIFNIALLVITLLITACEKHKDPIFESSLNERLEDKIDQIYQTLVGEERGWKIELFPDQNLRFGGYTLFARFNADSTVSMWTDFPNTSDTSHYTIYPGTGPTLSFNEFNDVIHFFSIPGFYHRQYYNMKQRIGSNELGLQGDLEYNVMRFNADSVILRGVRARTLVKMTPAEAPIESEVKRYGEITKKFLPFKNYTLRVGDQEFDLMFGDEVAKRAFFNPDVDYKTTMISFRFVPGGLEGYKEYTVEGVTFKDLKYREATDEYPEGYFIDANEKIMLIPGY